MDMYKFCVLFATVIATVYGTVQSSERVPVDVYYEALCPDSMTFFTKQLYPLLTKSNLSEFINLTLFPAGRTNYSKDSNTYTFDCHHGPDECAGNKVQACSLNLVENGKPSEGLGFNKLLVAFVNCLMDPSKAELNYMNKTKQCAIDNEGIYLAPIENCAGHVDGSRYLSEIVKKTREMNPTNIPSVVFNKQYSSTDSNDAIKNLKQSVCLHITEDKRPEECKNAAATLAGSLLLIFAFLKFHILF